MRPKALVAQRTERRTSNPQAEGSSPSERAKPSVDYRLGDLARMVEELEFETTRDAFRTALHSLSAAIYRERHLANDWRLAPGRREEGESG